MASLRWEKNGWASFQVFLIDDKTGRKKRTTIRSRITDEHEARLAKTRLQELINANHDGNAPSKSAIAWLNQQPARLRDWIEDAGIVEMRKDRVDALRAKERDNKAKAKADTTMAKSTVRRRTGIARQIFRSAVRMKVLAENPFDGLSATVTANPDREYFLSAEDARKCITAAKDRQWKTIIALCRFGGLRNPSETLSLTWDNIDTATWKTMTVLSPKTEHHQGKGWRTIPIFPHLLPYLQNAWREREQLPEDRRSKWVVTRYRDQKQNLRTTFTKIIKEAGLKPWPKLFQNMRASCETDLLIATNGKVKAVAKWMGHSPEISLRHYQLLTKELEDMALADLKVAHKTGALGEGITGHGRHGEPRLTQKPAIPAIPNVSMSNEWAIQNSNL